jgi:Cys-tRNA(Pro)/Cys-tRNA(Cys) deacylase
MINVKDILKITGYIRGGCSPIGMKKLYSTYLDDSAELLTKIVFSAGKIGIQLEIKVTDLLQVIKGELADLKK